MAYLARLKPYNERKGHKTRTYMIDGVRFMVERGWYEVSDAVAEQLRGLHQEHYDGDSPLLFDVCTVEEAEKLEQTEGHSEFTPKATARRPAAAVSTRAPAPPKAKTLPQETGDVMTTDATRDGLRVSPGTGTGEPTPGAESALAEGSPAVAGEQAARDTELGRAGSRQSPTTPGGVPGTQEMIDPDPDGKELEEGGDEDEGRQLEVGRMDSKAPGPRVRGGHGHRGK